MKKEIRVKEGNIIQITTEDERWYSREVNGITLYVPSVTWICDFYPKGVAFYKWLANKGWDESESLKVKAAEKGSKIHQAVEALLNGLTVTLETTFKNPDTGAEEELSADEYEAVMSFVSWFKVEQPEIIHTEKTVFDAQDRFAGTVDFVCRMKGGIWIVDFKTGQNIWPSYELQLSAYNAAMMANAKLAVLQLGYRRNKNKYKFTEVPDRFDLFLATREIWKKETEGISPLQRDFPDKLQLTIKKEAVHGEVG